VDKATPRTQTRWKLSAQSCPISHNRCQPNLQQTHLRIVISQDIEDTLSRAGRTVGWESLGWDCHQAGTGSSIGAAMYRAAWDARLGADMSEATDVVDRQVAAFRDRDLERFIGCYAADVKIRDFDGNVLMDGPEAMRGQYGPLFRDSPQLSVQIPSRMVAGDYVVDEENLSGFILTGFPPEMHAVVFYRVQGGLIRDVVLLT
jgi:hypothetical protein